MERMTQEGKNFEMKKGVYQFRGFLLEDKDDDGDGEVESGHGRGHITSRTTSHYQNHLTDLELIQYSEDALKNWNGEKVKVWDAQ